MRLRDSRRKNRLVAAVLLLATLIAALNFAPAANATAGAWRNINPTQYTAVPNLRLNSIYILNGGTSGKGSGDGWAVGNNGTIFYWDGFSWKNQTSTAGGCNLHSVNFGGNGIGSGSPPSVPMSPFASNAGFIVGGNTSQIVCRGEIALFWNGFSWYNMTTGLNTDTGNLTSVFMTCAYGSNSACSSTQVDVWAAGMNATAGTTYRLTGVPIPATGWTQVAVPGSTGCRINSIYMVSTLEGWAVGNCGKIYHWFGGGWTNPFTFAGVDFNSVFMDSASHGWAVGTDGEISQFIGGIWASPTSPATTSQTFRSISMVSSTEAWVVGDGATIVHLTYVNGAPTWSALAVNLVPTLNGLEGVHATGGSNVWADGDTGSILEYDGSIWGSITAPLQTTYNAVFMSGDSDAVAVGNRTVSGGIASPTVVRWDGVKWYRPQGASVAATDLYGAWEASSSEFWVVGGGEGVFPHVAHFNNGVFADVTPPTCPALTPDCLLFSVYGTASNNVWAVGTGGIFAHWDGTSWGTIAPFVALPNPTTTVWRSVTFVGGDPNKGWAVGFDSAAPSPEIYCYNNACAMLSSTPEAWASVSAPSGVPANTQLNSVSTELDNSNNVWIAGSNGVILLINGNTQTITPTFTVGTYNLTSIFVDSSTDGWAVGQDTATHLPVFLYYDGTSWTTMAISPPVPSTDTGRLNGMFLRSSTNGFAVGTPIEDTMISPASLGMMFHLDPPGESIATATSSSTSSSSASLTTIVSSSSTSSTSTSATTLPYIVTTSPSATTVVTTSISTLTVGSTPTTVSSATSFVSTPMVVPAIPGFPWESIIAGLMLGVIAIAVVRRVQRK